MILTYSNVEVYITSQYQYYKHDCTYFII